MGYQLHGLPDRIVDGHFELVQSLDDYVEELEDRLFDDVPRGLEVGGQLSVAQEPVKQLL